MPSFLNNQVIFLEISLQSQIFIFVYSLIFGAILGIIFDLFRIADIILKISFNRIFFEDVLYFAVIGVLSFLFMLVVNKGEFRIFIIFGELIGFCLYHFTLGRIVINFSKKIIKFLKKKISIFKNKFVLPIKRIFLKIKSFIFSFLFKNKLLNRKKAS